MVIAGTIIALDLGGGLARLRQRRAGWLGPLAEPVWFWRGFGAMAAASVIALLLFMAAR